MKKHDTRQRRSIIRAVIEVKEHVTDARGHDPLVVVGVDANAVALQVESVLAVFHVFELVLVQIGPPPQTGVDNVREAFTSSHLKKKQKKKKSP